MVERTAEQWGRIAVSLPGWKWMPGMRAMLSSVEHGPMPACPDRLDNSEALALETGGWIGQWPDPDDPATAGCLLALLGPMMRQVAPGKISTTTTWKACVSTKTPCWTQPMPLGRACIAAAEALGRWPGGAP